MRSILIATVTLLLTAACHRRVTRNSQPAPSATVAQTAGATGSSKINPASLLTGGDIQSVTGEPLKEPITSNRSEAGFAVSQCYFLVSTPSNSVVLTVTSRGAGADARDPRQFWAEKFHPDESKGAEEGEHPQTSPEAVPAVGNEAFWVESGSTGALYVLEGNRFIRVAVGGNDEKAARIAKAKRLAEFALPRLRLQ